MAKKKTEPKLMACLPCAQTGICPQCKGKGIETRIEYGFGFRSDQLYTLSCKMCGKGEVIGLDGIVAVSNLGKKGSGKCKACNGIGWVSIPGKLNTGAASASKK